MTQQYLGLPAPAKLNLFLHITGQRSDGMHNLQSVFQLIDLHDTIDLHWLKDPIIQRTGDLLCPIEQDLCYRAALALQPYAKITAGVRIHLTKRIPTQAGMGGGSSDAATTLLGLNRLWQCHLSREKLMKIAITLGADVPFFLLGSNAWVEGIGEKVTAINTPESSYLVIWPGVGIPTKKIFSSPLLTKNTKPVIIKFFTEHNSLHWPQLFGHNDLEPVAKKLEKNLQNLLEWGIMHNLTLRMTGSGSAAFSPIQDEFKAQALLKELPENWQGFITKSLSSHPLSVWGDQTV